MKKLHVTYFAPSGNYAGEERIEVVEGLDASDTLDLVENSELLEKGFHYAVVTDGNDGKEPYIPPKLFFRKKEGGKLD